MNRPPRPSRVSLSAFLDETAILGFTVEFPAVDALLRRFSHGNWYEEQIKREVSRAVVVGNLAPAKP